MTSFLKGEDTQTKLSHDVFLYLNATLNLISREREGYNAEQTLEALKIETSNFVKEVINDGREFGFFCYFKLFLDHVFPCRCCFVSLHVVNLGAA